jgi:hypothetical protein
MLIGRRFAAVLSTLSLFALVGLLAPAPAIAAGDVTPPGPVRSVVVSADASSVSLSWANPGAADFTGVMIRRSVGSTPPSTPTAGTLVADTAKPVKTFVDTGLTTGTTYSYALFAHDAVPNYAASANVTTAVSCVRPVIHLRGSLTADQTWTTACSRVVVLDGDVTIPRGRTLTIGAGVVIKAAGDVALQIDGTLNAVGTASSPVVFTSLKDDSAGGDTNGDGSASTPAPDDWAGITVGDTGIVDSEYAQVLYASTALNMSGAYVRLQSVTIAHVTSVMTVGHGSVGIRGSLRDFVTGISACNWGSDCSVDATNVDWGTGTSGPFPSNRDPLACGAILVSPWIGSTRAASLWSVQNCGGQQPLPDADLANAEAGYNQLISSLQIDCSGDYQEACDAIAQHQACYSAAERIAWQNVSVAGIPATPPDTGTVVDAVGDWLRASQNATMNAIGYVQGFVGGVVRAVKLYVDLTNAFHSCS